MNFAIKKNHIIFLIFIIPILTFAQLFSLRVFDNSFNLNNSSSKHFNYIYDKEISDMVPMIMSTAEAVYDTLWRLMGTKPYNKINLLITDYSDFPNGYSTPLLNPTINIYLSNPDPTFIAKHRDWVEYVLIHELTHSFHLTSLKPTCLAYFGNSGMFIPNVVQPMYLLEGYTVYNESTITKGRMKDTNFESVLRTMFMDRASAGIDRAASYNDREFPYGSLPYIYGPYIFDKLQSRNGKKIDNLLKMNFCTLVPIYSILPDLAVKANFGSYPSDALEEIYKDVAFKTQILEDSFNQNERINVTFSGFNNSLPCFHNGKLYFIKSYDHKNSRFSVISQNDTADYFKVTYSTGFTVSKNTVFIDMINYYDNSKYYFDIYSFNMSKKILKILPKTRRGFSPAVCGDTMFFIRSDRKSQRIILYSISRKSPFDSLMFDESIRFYSLNIKNDKQLIASVYRKGGYTDIAEINIESGDLNFLTSGIETDFKPVMSAERNGFYFVSDREGFNIIYFYDYDSAKISPVYTSFYNVSAFSVDETNDMIYVQDISANGSDIYKSKLTFGDFEDITLSKYKKYEPMRKKITENFSSSSYIIPKFSGLGAYLVVPIILPLFDHDSLNDIDTLHSTIFIMPFLNVNADIAQTFDFLLTSSPALTFARDNSLIGLQYPTIIQIISSHFPFDISFEASFDKTDFDGNQNNYAPNIYEITLSPQFVNSNFNRYIGFSPVIALKSDTQSFIPGGAMLFAYSSTESSVKSIIPSRGTVFNAKIISMYSNFEMLLNYKTYYAPNYKLNFFIEANAAYSHDNQVSLYNSMSVFNIINLKPKLSISLAEEGFNDTLGFLDYEYVKFGVLSPVKFINRGIPFPFLASLPIRFDYISVSASHIIGYSIVTKTYDKFNAFLPGIFPELPNSSDVSMQNISRLSINLGIDATIALFEPGISVTYNYERKLFNIGFNLSSK